MVVGSVDSCDLPAEVMALDRTFGFVHRGDPRVANTDLEIFIDWAVGGQPGISNGGASKKSFRPPIKVGGAGVRWRVSLASQSVIRPPTQGRWCVLLSLFGHSPFALEENLRNP